MIETDLPIEAVLAPLLAALEAGPNAVLVAPPGAGKTTRVPLALLDARFRREGRIVVLEPRRLAARAAALRMSAMIGEAVGGLVGYRTRIDGATSPATRIEVVTEGLLVARLLGDPTLDGVAAVLFDEIHERSLDGDLALALCLDLQRTRPELRLLAMSATPDTRALASLLGGGAGRDAPVIASDGRTHPVEIRHARRDLGHPPRELSDAVAAAARAALAESAADGSGGDLLCFLPGKAEIARAARALEGCGATVLTLHGEMRVEAQAEVLQPPARGERRIVLATSIAETSLTVPGVRTVIDGGFRRTPRHDQATGLARLATLRISRAAADQRAGRAGREAPGRCIRLWTQAAHRALAPFDRPEILEAELAGLRLQLAAWQAGWGSAPHDLRFADRPPSGALEAGGALLASLGALDPGGTITPLGSAMARLGTHPRLAAILLAASNADEAALASMLAALLEERDPLSRPTREPGSADIALRLDVIAGGDAPDADRAAIARIRDAARSFRRRLRPAERSAAGPEAGPGPAGPDVAGLLAAGFPDRVAQARGEPGQYRLSGGGSASLPPTDPLARVSLLVAPALHLGRSARITLAAPLDPESLPASLLARTTEQVERGVDPRTGSIHARRRRRLGALVLDDRVLPVGADEAASFLADAASGRLGELLDWTDAARNLQARAMLLRALQEASGETAPADLADAALAADAAPFLTAALRRQGATKLADLAGLDVARLLRDRLGDASVRALDRALPEQIELPGGRASVDFRSEPPVASARAQAFYGLDRTPVLAEGRVKLALALLSPAGRPVAITADLPGFWRGGWAEVRRDMRGRYPRHDWPEDPWTRKAQPRPPAQPR